MYQYAVIGLVFEVIWLPMLLFLLFFQRFQFIIGVWKAGVLKRYILILFC
jgi:hypothetical protein